VGNEVGPCDDCALRTNDHDYAHELVGIVKSAGAGPCECPACELLFPKIENECECE
jgi:hypothetical protein